MHEIWTLRAQTIRSVQTRGSCVDIAFFEDDGRPLLLLQFTIYSFVTPQPILDMHWICARRLSYALRCRTR